MTDEQHTDLSGEASNPPPPDLPQIMVIPGGGLPPQKKITLKDVAWRMVVALTVTLALLSLGAYIVTVVWEGIASFYGLPSIDWVTAFCGLVLIRILALTARTH